MRGIVTETIDQVGMTGLSVKIGLKEKIDQHAKIDHVVKTEVAVSNAENAGVVNVKIVEKEEDGKTVLVTMTVEVVITVVTNMEITTGIALNVRIPTSPSEQNVIVAANQKAKEEVENAAIIAGIIPVAVTLVVATPVVVIAVAEIIELNTVTMIGIAQSVKTRISVSVLNAIAVANPKDKVNRNAVVVVKVTPGVERVTHAVMVDR